MNYVRFSPFVQLNRKTSNEPLAAKDQQRGFGLGLGEKKKKLTSFFSKSKIAIAKDVVEASLNGKIFGQSDGIGHGATFGFEIPVELCEGEIAVNGPEVTSEEEAKTQLRVGGSKTPREKTLRGTRILCIDDSKVHLCV